MVAFVLGVIWALEEAESLLELVGGCCVTVDFDISYVIFVFFWGGVLWRNAGILVEKMIKPRKKKQQHAYF